MKLSEFIKKQCRIHVLYSVLLNIILTYSHTLHTENAHNSITITNGNLYNFNSASVSVYLFLQSYRFNSYCCTDTSSAIYSNNVRPSSLCLDDNS